MNSEIRLCGSASCLCSFLAVRLGTSYITFLCFNLFICNGIIVVLAYCYVTNYPEFSSWKQQIFTISHRFWESGILEWLSWWFGSGSLVRLQSSCRWAAVIWGLHRGTCLQDHSCSCGQASWLCAEDFSSSAHGPLHRPVWVSPRRERERETKTDRERGQPRWRPQPFYDLVSRVTRRPFSFILLIRTRHSVQPTFKRREIRPHLLRAASQRMWGHLF